MPYYPPPASSGSGDVTGPASATDNELVTFDLATGKIIQGGTRLNATPRGVSDGEISTAGSLYLSATTDTYIASGGVTYIDGVNADTTLANANSATQPGDNISTLTNDSGFTTNTGTVTSVAATVPTGMTVSGSPVTTTGTLALGYDTGYQGYTTAEATKLSGIEALADVTDATNVAAAGAIMDGDFSSNGIMKRTGAGTYATATSGTDYSAGTSALATGILKSTTTTGALSIAVAGDFPTLNQNTTGSAATLTTSRTFRTDLASTSTASFNGSANVTPGVTGTLAVGNGGTGVTSSTGSGANVLGTSPVLTTPILDGTYIKDNFGNAILFCNGSASSAPNYLLVSNAATASHPYISANGTDTNVNINLIPKGTGRLTVTGVNVPTISSTDTLTNKTIDATSNTLSNIGSSSLASSITTPTFNTGWSGLAGHTVRITRKGGWCYLSGIASKSSGWSAGELILTIPSGYRPMAGMFDAYGIYNAETTATASNTAEVSVFATDAGTPSDAGKVITRTAGSSGQWYSFYGISYPCE